MRKPTFARQKKYDRYARAEWGVICVQTMDRPTAARRGRQMARQGAAVIGRGRPTGPGPRRGGAARARRDADVPATDVAAGRTRRADGRGRRERRELGANGAARARARGTPRL